MNCFQKLLSSWRGTTFIAPLKVRFLLWIAFKNYYLRDEEQQNSKIGFGERCCELLSKIIIFVTRNNKNWRFKFTLSVVNCFQKLLSSWRGTTEKSWVSWQYLLWIAFKNYYLRDEEQPSPSYSNTTCCCELLSKIIIFVTRNNNIDASTATIGVVNCFQKLLSSWRGTTFSSDNHLFDSLWIAFKNYYLRDEEQLLMNRKRV